MTLLLPAVLLAALGAEPLRGPAVYSQNLSVQDTQPRVLLELEDAWALALIHRDAAVFRRLLAERFIYTEDDRTMTRDDVLRDIVAGPDTAKTAHDEDMGSDRSGETAVVTGGLVVGGTGADGQ